MKIEAGKTYIMRDGRVVSPSRRVGGYVTKHPWVANIKPTDTNSVQVAIWTDNGVNYDDIRLDIVSEYGVNPPTDDPVNHPSHYTSHPSGVECIQVTEHMNFNIGNAVKYLWRNGQKGDAVQDLEKAVFYIQREIARISK